MPPKKIPTRSIYINRLENNELREKTKELDSFFEKSGLNELETELRQNKKRQDNQYNDIIYMDNETLEREIEMTRPWYNIEKSNLEDAISRSKEYSTLYLGEINSKQQDILKKKKGFTFFNCFLEESVKKLEDELSEKKILYKNVQLDLQRLNIDSKKIEKTHRFKLLINELERRKKISENAREPDVEEASARRQKGLSVKTLTSPLDLNNPYSRQLNQEKQQEFTADGLPHSQTVGNHYSIHSEKQPGLPVKRLTSHLALNNLHSRH
jgi:hypothetical protein